MANDLYMALRENLPANHSNGSNTKNSSTQKCSIYTAQQQNSTQSKYGLLPQKHASTRSLHWGEGVIIITHTLLYCHKAITSEAASANKHHHQLALNYIHTTYRNPTWFSIMSIIYRLITGLAGT